MGYFNNLNNGFLKYMEQIYKYKKIFNSHQRVLRFYAIYDSFNLTFFDKLSNDNKII
jgi:hypothetical protein